MSLKREKSSYIKTAGRRFTGLDNHPPTHTYTHTHTHTHTTPHAHTHTRVQTQTLYRLLGQRQSKQQNSGDE